jgi:hypothetical protein
VRQRHRRPSFPAVFSSATTLGYDRLPSTLITLGPNVGLIHPPGAANGLLLPAASFVQFGRVALNPTPDSGVVGGDAPLREEFLDVPIGQGKSQIPAHRPGNDGRFEVAPFEQGWPGFAHQGIISGARTPPSQLCNTSAQTVILGKRGGQLCTCIQKQQRSCALIRPAAEAQTSRSSQPRNSNSSTRSEPWRSRVARPAHGRPGGAEDAKVNLSASVYLDDAVDSSRFERRSHERRWKSAAR